jgi:hypothetical protein
VASVDGGGIFITQILGVNVGGSGPISLNFSSMTIDDGDAGPSGVLDGGNTLRVYNNAWKDV